MPENLFRKVFKREPKIFVADNPVRMFFIIKKMHDSRIESSL